MDVSTDSPGKDAIRHIWSDTRHSKKIGPKDLS